MKAPKLTAWILVSYVLVALIQAWPLPLHLSSRLTGPVGGDTGVYVWNTWVFRHELVVGHQSPFSTLTILPLDGPTDLSLHNYTVFADLVTLPLQPLIGVVAAFNVVYLLNVALAGFGMYLLAKRVTGRVAESWLAGLLFAWSPFLVARGGAHFSLAAAAPLPLFAYWIDRAWDSARVRDACAAGVMLAWATFSDPYYGVYCLLLAIPIIARHVVRVSWEQVESHLAPVLVELAITTLVCLIVVVHYGSGGTLRLASVTLQMRSLYTPMLVLTLLIALRVWMAVRPRIEWQPPVLSARLLRGGLVAAFAAALLLAPELYAIVLRAAEGRMVAPPVLWRSSAPGLDLISFLLPNPNHPLAPHWIADWFAREPGRYEENVASLPLVGFAVLIAAVWLARFRPSRLWLTVTLGFMSLALGPFLRVAGVTTFIPTPWALFRYIPVIGEARMPPRFAVLVVLGFAVLFASALVALRARYPARRRMILAVVGVALAFELLPAPRTLYSAEIPSIYRTIAADPRPVRVLELPFGVRDGLSSLGDFSAASQFRQTLHGKPLIGGYLSRVEDSTKTFNRTLPPLDILLAYGEGRSPAPDVLARARVLAPDFITRAHIGYVVIDRARVSAACRDFVIQAFKLKQIDASDTLELYVPTGAPTRQARAEQSALR